MLKNHFAELAVKKAENMRWINQQDWCNVLHSLTGFSIYALFGSMPLFIFPVCSLSSVELLLDTAD